MSVVPGQLTLPFIFQSAVRNTQGDVVKTARDGYLTFIHLNRSEEFRDVSHGSWTLDQLVRLASLYPKQRHLKQT